MRYPYDAMREETLPVRRGELIGGKYKVENVLGHGGMAVVVAARHQELDELVAIKILLPHRAEHADVRARFAREARMAVKIKSEHVARIIDVGALQDGTPYIVMEYLEGEDLATLLSRRHRVPVTEALLYALQVCDAIREAHSLGIIHRDIKPANLFLAKTRGRPPSLKVLDFGISKVEHHDRRRTETKEILGSPWYMAPEQMQSSTSADPRADIWSLGIILYELLTGEVPFDGETMTEVIVKVLHDEPILVEVPSPFDAVIRRCLAKDPGDRYGTIDELATALRALERPSRVSKPPVPRASLTPRPAPVETIPEEALVDLEDGEVVDVGELLPSEQPPNVAASAPPSARGARATPTPTPAVARASVPPSAPPVDVAAQAADGVSTSPPPAKVPDSRQVPTLRPPRPATAAAPARDRVLWAWGAGLVALLVVPGAVMAMRSSRSVAPSSPTESTPTPTKPMTAFTTVESPPTPTNAPHAITAATVESTSPTFPTPSAVAVVAPPPRVDAVPSPVPTPARTAAVVEATAPVLPREPAPPREPTPPREPRPKPVVAVATPKVAPTPAPASAGDDAAVGFQVARKNQAGTKECWEGSSKTTSVVQVVATVNANGAVVGASAKATDAAFAQCVEGKVRSWTFPAADTPRTFNIPIRVAR